MHLSNITQSIKPSLTRHLFNLAKAYDDVIDFTLGDPDIPPHQAIRMQGVELFKKVELVIPKMQGY